MKYRKFLRRAATGAVIVAMLTMPAHASETQKLDAYYSLALRYIETAEYDRALNYINACFDYFDEAEDVDLAADLYLKRACVYTMQGENETALQDLEKTLELAPETANAYLVRAQIYTNSGLYSEAITDMEKYIELSGDESVYGSLAQLYEASGDYENALSSYDTYTASADVSEEEAAYQRGVYKMDLGLFSEAITEFSNLTEDETFGISSLYNIGVCNMNIQNYDEALAAFTDCIEGGGSFDGLYYNRAVCEMTQSDYESAIADFSTSVESESYVEDALYNRAICLMSSGNYSDAVVDFTTYLGQDENSEIEAKENDVALYYRAVCEMSIPDYDAAAIDFTACMDAGIMPEESLFNRGLSYLQSENAEAAITDFTTVIEQVEGQTEADSAAVSAETEQPEAEATTDPDGDESIAEVVVDDIAVDAPLTTETADEEADAPDETAEETTVSRADEARYYRSFAYRMQENYDAALADLNLCIEHGYDLSNVYYQRAKTYLAMGDEDKYYEDLEMSVSY